MLLARLQAVATNQAAVRDVAQLRREAETGPVTALPSVVVRALALTDRLCWDSLERGDPAAFTCQAAICAELPVDLGHPIVACHNPPARLGQPYTVLPRVGWQPGCA